MHIVSTMLGSFLEFSIAVGEVGEALPFYRSLGFQDLPTGDFIATPYAAVWDGGLVIGLTQNDEPPGIRFVRPSLREHLPALRRQRIEIDAAELGEDAFNRLVFVDNAGHRVELVEARTYSQAEREPGHVAALGRFAEISLPTHSVDESAEFWAAFGFRVDQRSDDPCPRVRLTGCGCSLGFHQANFRPGPSFTAPSFGARTEFLRARGIRVTAASQPRLGRESARVESPGGTALYLHADDD